MTGLPTSWARLDRQTVEWETEINEAMDGNEDIVRYVRYLEHRYDADAESSLPTSDDLAEEFEHFLRQHGLRQHGNEPPS